MKNKKILLAFDSQTMLAFMSQMVEESGYSLIAAADGVAALEMICAERPACVLVYIDLPVVGGWDLSRIVKNSPQIKNTSVIICSNEESSVYHFWKEKSQSDGFLVIHKLDSETLSKTIEAAVQKNKSAAGDEKSLPADKKEMVRLIADASGRELFNLYIVQSAYNTGVSTFGVEQLADSMVKDLAGICNYDALGIMINDEVLIERYDYNSNMSQKDIDEFMHLCHKDFEAKAKLRKNYDWRQSTIKETRFDVKYGAAGKLKSYEMFPTEKAGVVTVHIASSYVDAFNKRLDERVDFFTKIYSSVIEKNIRFKKVNSAEQKIRKAFSRFVPETVIDEIIAGNEAAQASVGEKRQIAIMMADIRNFTNISEINEPEKVVNFLNYFFSLVGPIIKRNGGTIDKFMGDAIMALFGAPESFDDNGNRAARAALEIMEAVKTIDTSKIALPRNYTFAIGIGVHYGTPIVGAIGNDDKREYTVIGDDVNLASRVEGLTKMYGTPIIITGATKNDLREDYNGTRLLDKVRVKGKTDVVEIYEMMTEKEKYSEKFLDLYQKGVKQYLLGNFNGAIEYFELALQESVEDKASSVLLGRCKTYEKNPPENWDGAVSLVSK